MKRSSIFLGGLLLAASCLATSAEAHKLLLSYWFSDGEIVGEVGLSNGTFASAAPIEVSDADGALIAVITSGGDGLFRYRPLEAADHSFYTDLGGGHIARFKVSKEEIATGGRAPRADQGAGLVQAEIGASGPDTSGMTLEQRRALPPSGSAADQATIKSLIRQELTPLRREIVALREKNSFQSILGGIGYIVGLFGLAMFWMARQAGKGQAGKGQASKGQAASTATAPPQPAPVASDASEPQTSAPQEGSRA